MTKSDLFKDLRCRPEIIPLAVMPYIRFPLALRKVEGQLNESGTEISQETVRFWLNRFGPMCASEIRQRRVPQLRAFPGGSDTSMRCSFRLMASSTIGGQPWNTKARGWKATSGRRVKRKPQ
jgi:hypothetical protein